MKVSLIIPVFNEENLLLEVLRRVAGVPFPDKELIVVDDRSSDGTAAVLDRIEKDPSLVLASASGQTQIRIFRQPVNRGKGAALHLGIREATGDAIVVQDADLEYDPFELPALVELVARGEADVVYGSRFLKGHQGFPLLHTLANRMLTVASNLITGLRVTDMETCYKVVRADILRALPLREERFGFEPEVTALLGHWRRQHGLVLQERPVSYRPRSLADGKKIRLKDAFRAVYCILRYGLLTPSPLHAVAPIPALTAEAPPSAPTSAQS
jgi:glycosyltransferase involved in cell wall biosynthesis